MFMNDRRELKMKWNSSKKKTAFLLRLFMFLLCFYGCSSAQDDGESFNFSEQGANNQETNNNSNGGSQGNETFNEENSGWNNAKSSNEALTNSQPSGNVSPAGMVTNPTASTNFSGNLQGVQEVETLANELAPEESINDTNMQNPQEVSGESGESVVENKNANANALSEAAPGEESGPSGRERVFYALKENYVQAYTPITAELRWVGYDYKSDQGVVKITITTTGSPKFIVLQEVNKSRQSEVIIRFFGTNLWKKLRRDIDASEFHSPVAFIRMRPNTENNTVDVVLTLREIAQPRLMAHNGNVMITFPIPDRYYGNYSVGAAPIGFAEYLSHYTFFPEIEDGSELPDNMKRYAFIADPGEKIFKDMPKEEGKLLALKDPNEAAPGEVNGNGNVQAVSDEYGNLQSGEAEILNNISVNAGNMNSSGGASEQSMNAPLNQGIQGSSGAGMQQFDNSGFGNPEPSKSSKEKINNKGKKKKTSGGGGSNSDFGDFEENSVDFEGDDWTRLKPGSSEKPRFEVVRSFSLMGVAQDNGAGGGGNANFGNFGSNAAGSNAGGSNEFGNASGGPSAKGGNVFPSNTVSGASGNFKNPTQSGNENLFINNKNLEMNSPENKVEKGKKAKEAAATKDYEMAISEELEGQDVEMTTEPASLARSINMDFRGAPLIEVIRAISEESGRNFILGSGGGGIGANQRAQGGSVDPNTLVNVSLKDIPWTDALKAILETHNLGMIEVSPNVIRIDSLNQLIEEKKDIIEARKITALLTPKKTLVVRLSHAKAQDLVPTVQSILQEAIDIDKSVRVVADTRSNSLVIEAIPNDLARLKLLVERLDRPTPQIKIVTRMAEVLKDLKSALGINWGGQLNYDQARGLGFGTMPFPNYMTSNYAIDTGAGGIASPRSSFDIHFGSINNAIDLDLQLRLGEVKQTTKVLQTNTVYVADLQEAKIVGGRSDYFRILGDNISLPNAAGGGGGNNNIPGMSQVKYHTEMTVRPQVTGDGQIQLEITLESNDPRTAAGSADASSTDRSLKTTLLRKNGETVVIGGLYSSNSDHLESGFPYLSSLPIIGALFRTQINQDTERDLLMMVTPTILNAAEALGKPAKATVVSSNAAAAASSNISGSNNVFSNNASLNGNAPPPSSGNVLPANGAPPANGIPVAKTPAEGQLSNDAKNFGDNFGADPNAAAPSQGTASGEVNNLENGEFNFNEGNAKTENGAGDSSMDDYADFE